MHNQDQDNAQSLILGMPKDEGSWNHNFFFMKTTKWNAQINFTVFHLNALGIDLNFSLSF